MLATSFRGWLRPLKRNPDEPAPYRAKRVTQLQAGLLVAGGNCDFREILLVVSFRVAGGVLGQTEYGSFFRLRPQPFAANVGADSTENVGTKHAHARKTQITMATKTPTMISSLLAIGRRRNISP